MSWILSCIGAVLRGVWCGDSVRCHYMNSDYLSFHTSGSSFGDGRSGGGGGGDNVNCACFALFLLF